MRSKTYVDGEGVLQRVCVGCGQTLTLTVKNFSPQKSNKNGYNIRCKPCEAEFKLAYKERKANVDADGKTLIHHPCGHDFRYRIRRTSAVQWLKQQPCPKCRRDERKLPEPKLPEPKSPPKVEPKTEIKPEPVPEPPKPAPRPKVDKAWVKSIMGFIPKGVFHSALLEVILLVKAGLPVWLQGPPGTSKSTLALQAAQGLELGFYPISCHELMTRSDLFGYTDAVGADHRTPLWDAYERGGVVLLDEVDNGNPNLLAALNSALSNGHCVFGSGTIVQRHADFRVIATANTAGLGPEHGYIGRNGVDLATRDRFVTVQVPIDSDLEAALAEVYMGAKTIDDLQPDFRARAEWRLGERSIKRESPDALRVLESVRRVRQAVDSRFRGSVVSPRMTIHAAAMVASGFTLREAVTSKLPGLKDDEVSDLLRSTRITETEF